MDSAASPAARLKFFEDYWGKSVRVPPLRQRAPLVFLIIWSVLWFFGGGYFIVEQVSDPNSDRSFLWIWSIIWALASLLVAYFILRDLVRFEVITINEDTLLHKVAFVFVVKDRKYHLADVKRMRWVEIVHTDEDVAYVAEESKRPGHLAFDHGRKTVKIARGVTQAEGQYLIDALNQAASPHKLSED